MPLPIFIRRVCRVVFGAEQTNSASPFLPWMLKKATKGLIALTPEIDYDQTAMGLLPATSVVFLIPKYFL
jgi:hypothetical protein